MKRKLLIVMVCVAFIVTNTAICFASDGLESYDITSLKELDETIEEFSEEGISKSDGEWIIYVTIYEKLNIKYVKNDTKNKKMKVKYTWSKTKV